MEQPLGWNVTEVTVMETPPPFATLCRRRTSTQKKKITNRCVKQGYYNFRVSSAIKVQCQEKQLPYLSICENLSGMSAAATIWSVQSSSAFQGAPKPCSDDMAQRSAGSGAGREAALRAALPVVVCP
jgi:hypothetical protein